MFDTDQVRRPFIVYTLTMQHWTPRQTEHPDSKKCSGIDRFYSLSLRARPMVAPRLVAASRGIHNSRYATVTDALPLTRPVAGRLV